MRLVAQFLGLLAAICTLSLPVRGLYRDIAVIAYHFHWPRNECMSMSRRERSKWLEEIGRINREIAKSMKAKRKRG